jgi:hypothetical protein
METRIKVTVELIQDDKVLAHLYEKLEPKLIVADYQILQSVIESMTKTLRNG